MKHVVRFLIRLYPAWWRRRYGSELEALLEDSGSQDVWDLFRGAMETQMKTWSFAKVVIVCGIAGTVLAGAVAFSMPYRYRSTAILRSVEHRSPEDWDALNQAAFTPQALSSILRQEHLYADAPEADGVDRLRRAIRLEPADQNLVQISFAYNDPVQAQRVSQELVDRIVAANLGSSANPQRQAIQLVAPADQPTKQIERKRYGLAGLGFPVGLLFGVALAAILRRRAPATN